MTTPGKSVYSERFSNRVAVVTGGASGVGLEVAARIATEGGEVTLGKTEEVAALVCWLASEECSFSTAATFDISGGRTTY